MEAQRRKQQPSREQQGPRWWQLTQTLFLPLIVVMSVALIGVILCGYVFGWQWTGVASTTEVTSTTKEAEVTRTVKDVGAHTLWDWLQLLFVPVVIGGATYWYRRTERELEQGRADERAAYELKQAEQRANSERQRAEQRAALDRQIAKDNRQEAALQTYLDRMSELLLQGCLRDAPEAATARAVARARTLTLLHQLDPERGFEQQDGEPARQPEPDVAAEQKSERKGAVIRFLHESKLILRAAPIVDLVEADLTKADLIRAHLEQANLAGAALADADLAGSHLAGANLAGTRLSRANLAGADLTKADLAKAKLVYSVLRTAKLGGADLQEAQIVQADLNLADLTHANLTKANLTKANLTRADLRSANLSGANLTGATLNWANLTSANLAGAILTQEQLAVARRDEA